MKESSAFLTELHSIQKEALSALQNVQTPNELESLYLQYFGTSGSFTSLFKKIKDLSIDERKNAGAEGNKVKTTLTVAFESRKKELAHTHSDSWFDVTIPGILPPTGHLHLVSTAIEEIAEIFARIGFYRVRYPEIDSDYYAFESLNMPQEHAARDEWETFFVSGNVVLTPHTSNGQVREMERMRKITHKNPPPIRMINIGKCYRRQSDVSHVPMFHQFEGLYVDKDVSIAHLKGVLDYFVKQFFGPKRTFRIRPFHFQFTEPSFEIDLSCGVCEGKGVLPSGESCRLCKEGWLELGGAGMVHPTVLKNGGFDPSEYSGFAFGWGVERTYMMKEGIKIDDIRLLYSNDVRFLEQF